MQAVEALLLSTTCPASDYGGWQLVYLGNYRSMDDPLVSASKEGVRDEFLPHLERINPASERS